MSNYLSSRRLQSSSLSGTCLLHLYPSQDYETSLADGKTLQPLKASPRWIIYHLAPLRAMRAYPIQFLLHLLILSSLFHKDPNQFSPKH